MLLENNDPDNLLFDGDMMLIPTQRKRVEIEGDIFSKPTNAFAAMNNVSILWLPNNKVVPYIIVADLGRS